MATDLGTDIDCADDHGMSFGVATGRKNLANALARRLMTPRGGLFYDPDYGLDVRAYLNAAITDAKLAELAQAIEAECRKDPRVQDVSAAVSVDRTSVTRGLKLKLAIEDADGPFTDILTISDRVTRGS